MKKQVLFLTLKVFSATGGIEKVSRLAGKAFYEICEDENKKLEVISLHDETWLCDPKYLPAKVFKGYSAKIFPFVKNSVAAGINSRIVVLSHINLLLVGWLIKLLSPKTKLVLIAHGIEVWKPLPFWKRYMLKRCDRILAVSDYTRTTMNKLHKLNPEKCIVVNNCLDPFLTDNVDQKKIEELKELYNVTSDNIVLMTLSRISSKEKYKGFDKVINALKDLKYRYPLLKYMVVGMYDDSEKVTLDKLIATNNLQNEVIFTGFIPDQELAAHFNLADIYIMPSEKEGFGIVFIEAMFYGKPVIASSGNGSTDALLNGKLGVLIDPKNPGEASQAIEKIIKNRDAYIPNRALLMENFSFPVYKDRLRNILKEVEEKG